MDRLPLPPVLDCVLCVYIKEEGREGIGTEERNEKKGRTFGGMNPLLHTYTVKIYTITNLYEFYTFVIFFFLWRNALCFGGNCDGEMTHHLVGPQREKS